MIPGNPVKLLIADDTDRSDQPARELLRKGYDVELSTVDMAMQTALSFWPDYIVLTTGNTSIEITCAASPFLRHIKVIHCHD